MFNYLIVKDNLEFKSGSFVKFVAPFMFDKLSQALDVTLDELNKKDNIQEKNTLGDNFGKIGYDFRKSFATYVGNQYMKLFYRKLAGKEGWVKDVDGNMTFNSRNADGTSNDKARDYLENVFETESQEYVNKKTGEKGSKVQFIFPQFAIFDKTLYELVSYKEFDKTKFHDLTESKHVGTSANYAPLEFVGNKKVSPYPLGYESNVESSLLQKKAKEQEKKKSEYEDTEPDEADSGDIDAAVSKQAKNAQVGNIGSESIKFDEAKLSSVKLGIEISSNSKGLAAALTNPTELAKSKGNITESYPVEFKGKIYKDAESAYQSLKSTATKDEGANSTYNLMVDIIKAKLKQHPRLVSEITKQGGSKWVLSSTHQPTSQNSVWETGGKNWFIKALNEAYISTQSSTSVAEQSKPKNKYSLSSDVASELANEKLQESEKKPILSTSHQGVKKDLIAAGISVPDYATEKEIMELYKKYCKGGK